MTARPLTLALAWPAIVMIVSSCDGRPGSRLAAVPPGMLATAGCVIPAEAQADLRAAPFDVLAARTGTTPIARLARREGAAVIWSELPALGEVRVARVALRGEGIRVAGWASLVGQEMEVRDRLEIVPDHVWVPRGARVEVLGTREGAVVVAAATHFERPAFVEVAAPCGAFGAARATTRAPAGPPYALATGKTVELRATPGGPIVFTFAPRPTTAWVWLDRRGDYAHLAGGQPAEVSALDGETGLLFDGWVRADEVRRVEALDGGDGSSGYDPADLVDQCPIDRAGRDAPLFAGAAPGGAPIGSVDHGTALELGEHRGGFVAVTTRNHVVVPAPGQRFWIREGDVEVGCASPVDDGDGCPSCPAIAPIPAPALPR
jgi:hypothetical protein